MDLINKLRNNGNRITESRSTICKILEEAGHEHFTADELYHLALNRVQDIDLATVYRTLEILGSLDLCRTSTPATWLRNLLSQKTRKKWSHSL